MRTLWLIVVILAPFAFLSPSFGQAVANITDEALLKRLASTDRVEAEETAKEILRRGEPMIPLLMKQKGNRTLFYGTFELDPPSQIIAVPTADKHNNDRLLEAGKLTTIEVASLFLINAIFWEGFNFAQTPYLVDRSLPSEKQKAANKKYLVKKAWKAVEAWSLKLEKHGIALLRKEEMHPFDETDIDFF